MKKIFLIASIVTSFFIGSFGVHASDIRIVTNKTIVSAGETVNASVYIDSPTESINNAEGTISFPKGLITTNSINSAGSIFSMWVEQPNFSNSAGTITFNGGIPNPGYKGSSGKVFDISFTAQSSGTIEIAFSNVAIRLNDGSGTNVVSQKIKAVLNQDVVPAPTPVPTPEATPTPTPTPTPSPTPTPPSTVGQVPEAPVVFSQDMPNEDEWYNFSGTTFSWAVPDDVLSTQLFLGSFPDSIPSVTYTPAIKSKFIPSLSEGVWYLHARFRNQAGWGKITHHKILVDSSAPTDISATYATDEKGNLVLTMSGKDAYSGIAKYIIDLDLSSRKLMEVEASKGNDFTTSVTLPALIPGEHNIVVTAYDHVGNVSSASVKIVAPNLSAPEITSYPEKINKGEVFTVSGKSQYADTDLVVYVQETDAETKKFLIRSLANGDFEFTSAVQANDGIVTVYAKNVITDGTSFESDASKKVYVLVEKSAFIKISSKLTSLLSLIVPIVALVMLLVWLVYIAIRRVKKMKKNVRRNYSTEDQVHSIFGVLKDDVKKYLAVKSKPSTQSKLTIEEKAALKDLADDLEKSEEYFRKKFESIKK